MVKVREASRSAEKGRARSWVATTVAAGALLALVGTDLIRPAAANASPNVPAASAQIVQDQAHAAFLADPLVQRTLAEIRELDAAANGRTAAVAGPALASRFGTMFLRSLMGSATNQTLSYVLRELGYNPGDQSELIQGLTEIQDGLNDIMAQNRQIIVAIEELHNEVLRANFKRANAEVVRDSNNIQDILRVLRHWIDHDITPDQATVSLAVWDLRAQSSDLRGAASDPDSGAVPLLLQAYDRNVSDTEQLWEAVTEYRDQVRVSLAQAVAGIELAIEHWDHPTGEYGASHAVARESALATVDAMFATGVSATGPGGQEFVQLKNNRAISALPGSGSIHGSDTWLWQRHDVTQAHTEPLLQEMVSKYRPARHGNQTLESFLSERGIPTSYVYTDTWRQRTTYHKTSDTRRDVRYRAEVTLAQITGNEYRTQSVTFGEGLYAGFQRWNLFEGWRYPTGTSNEIIQNYEDRRLADNRIFGEVSSWQVASRGDWSTRLAEWRQDSAHHNNPQGRISLSKEGFLTGGGWLADTRTNSIRQAAYGLT